MSRFIQSCVEFHIAPFFADVEIVHKIIEVVRNENSEIDLNVLAIAGGYIIESNVGRKYENDKDIPYTGKSKLTFIEAIKK